MSAPRELPLDLAGPAGRLEALRFLPGEPPAGGALILHPHPLYGGNLHNKVVFTCQQVCARLGLATLRFNFRGVGSSAGRYDDGQGELADARAALTALATALPGLPLHAVGFSFGAWIALRLAASEAQVVAVTAIGTPVDWAELDFLADCAKPKLFIHGEEDQFCDPVALAHRYPRFAPPKRLEWVAGADHFFTNRLPALSQVLAARFPLPGADWPAPSPPA